MHGLRKRLTAVAAAALVSVGLVAGAPGASQAHSGTIDLKFNYDAYGGISQAHRVCKAMQQFHTMMLLSSGHRIHTYRGCFPGTDGEGRMGYYLTINYRH